MAILFAFPCAAGTIQATLDAPAPPRQAMAVERKFTRIGVYEGVTVPGAVAGNRVVFQDVPPGRYDLRFVFDKGTVEGWDATVPASDYVQEQPLSEQGRQAVLKKLSDPRVMQYDDEFIVLDIQGNVQNAAILTTQLRVRPFVGGGYKPGEWTWRVTRWQYENPDEDTWVPVQERPYYALVRLRLFEKDYQSKAVTYARHLGGIVVADREQVVDLGTIKLPSPRPGIHAVNPDGTPTVPVLLKSGSEQPAGNAP